MREHSPVLGRIRGDERLSRGTSQLLLLIAEEGHLVDVEVVAGDEGRGFQLVDRLVRSWGLELDGQQDEL